MNYKVSRRDARLSAVLLSPFDRLEAGATWAKASAAIGAAAQYAYHDAFIGALLFVIVSGVADYIVGVRAARLTAVYDVQLAHRGALGKISGLLLLLLVRSFEHYLYLQGLTPNTRGSWPLRSRSRCSPSTCSQSRTTAKKWAPSRFRSSEECLAGSRHSPGRKFRRIRQPPTRRADDLKQ
jgi:hypothetical protein